MLTLTPVGAGNAVVTVTPSNSGGIGSAQIIEVTVAEPPTQQRPEIEITFAPVKFAYGDMDPDTFTLSMYFTGATSYDVMSSMPSVATAEEAEGVLTITPVAAGDTVVTVTAINDAGQRTQNIAVNVAEPQQQQRPEIEITFAPVKFAYGDMDPDTFTLSMYFTGATSYDVMSSMPSVATAEEAEGVLTITPVAAGDTVVTVTAINDAGQRTQNIAVNVAPMPNMPPTVKKTLSSVRLIPDENRGDSTVVDESKWESMALNDYFMDPENRPLSFMVEIVSQMPTETNTKVVEIVTEPTGFEDDVQIDAISTGTATIRVTATDSESQRTSQAFVITVVTAVNDPAPAGSAIDDLSGATRLKMGDDPQKVVKGELFSDHFSDADLTTEAGDVLTFSIKYVVAGSDHTAAALAADKVVATATISPTTWSGDPGGSAKKKFTVTVTPKNPGAAHEILIVATDLSGTMISKGFEVQVNQAPLAQGAQAENPMMLSTYESTVGLSASTANITIALVADDDGYFHDDDGDDLTCSAVPSDTDEATAPAAITIANNVITVDPHNEYKSTFRPMTVTAWCNDGFEDSPKQSFTVSVSRLSVSR